MSKPDSPPNGRQDATKRRQTKNRVMAGLLLAFAVLLFIVTLIRMEQQPHPPREIGGIEEPHSDVPPAQLHQEANH